MLEREPARLPRGAHGMSRELVVSNQRERLFRGMAEAMDEKGYVRTTVADVLRRSGVGRETFYQQFTSKEDCFLAAYETSASLILAGVQRGGLGALSQIQRFEQTIGEYLDALAAEPAFARLFMIEVYAAGETVLRKRAEVQRRFVAAITMAFEAGTPAERFACETLVAAIIGLVTARLAERDLDGLRALRGPLTELVSAALDRR